MWNDLDKPWQEAFIMAWEAYKNGTIPIGCVIVSQSGEIISRGRNEIYDLSSKRPLAGTNMAHAEMNALLGLKRQQHEDHIRSYSLYTTMEPCPMCFGTMVMMNIRDIYFGALDNFAGATSLNDKMEYIKNKEINIRQGNEEIEAFQLIMQSAYEYEREQPRIEQILDKWRDVNNIAINCGQILHKEGFFPQAIKQDREIEKIYDEAVTLYWQLLGTNEKRN